VPGNVPAPLIDNDPGPVHGRPVSGFVPVVLDRSPVGVDGETLSSDRADKSVFSPLSTGLTVFPLSSGMLVFRFCASPAVVVRMTTPRPISPMQFATMWVEPPVESCRPTSRNVNDFRARQEGQMNQIIGE
jgi:hypothetical protein